MNVYEIVTNKVLGALETGVAPWRKPWVSNSFTINGKRHAFPFNAVSKKDYRGINSFLLSIHMSENGYTDPRYVTFKQAQTLGGSVKKGQKGTMVVFWKITETKPTEETDETSGVTDPGKPKKYLILRYYTVFNVAQCEGLELPTADPIKETKATKKERLKEAEAIVKNLPAGLRIPVHTSDKAAYSPAFDCLYMPEFDAFETAEGYHATLFHEYIHATGAEKRLKRSGIVNFDGFGSEQYSREELIAEMGSAFLCATAGIDNADQSAAYIAGWKKFLSDDSRAVVIAAAQAQKAAEYILGESVGSGEEDE